MIKKIIVLSDFVDGIKKFLKTGSNLRITYMLRSLGYEVLPIHHCMSFNMDELSTIIDNFADGQKIAVCMSTSFIISRNYKNLKYIEEDFYYDPKVSEPGAWWGAASFEYLMNISRLVKGKNHTLIFGGWAIIQSKFSVASLRNAWGIDELSKYVDCFSLGNNVDVIDSICKDKSIDYITLGNSKLAKTSEITDFSDCASTPLIPDSILTGESLTTEIAAGCIFSCSFCNYAALGKKKKEFVRSYDSFKHEIISNYKNFNTTLYTLTDNIINDYEEKIKYMIRVRDETGIDFRWVGYLRLDTIKTKEQAKLLADSGIAGATFGVESLKSEVGRYIGKLTDKNKLIEHANIFREAVGDNCLVMGSFIAGLPTENYDELTQTFEWLQSKEGRHLIDSYTFSTLTIFEGNENKNEINRSRNNPFRDYEKVNNTPNRWTSPWGDYNKYADFATHFNNMRRNALGGFTPPMIVNLGIPLETVLKLGRLKASIPIPNEKLYINTEKYIQQYKAKIKDLWA